MQFLDVKISDSIAFSSACLCPNHLVVFVMLVGNLTHNLTTWDDIIVSRDQEEVLLENFIHNLIAGDDMQALQSYPSVCSSTRHTSIVFKKDFGLISKN
jgi:hypothetical protein